MQEHETIKNLCIEYCLAKRLEKDATDCRVSIGNKIADAIGVQSTDEGSRTLKYGQYKVTVKATINRKVDWDKFDEVSVGQSDPPVKAKRELDVPGLKWISENNVAYYEKLVDAITATPGRAQIEIKEVKE